MSSVQCNGQLLRSPENGRINCPDLNTWIAEAGERCRLECDSGYTPSIERITCYDYGWSIPSSSRLKASQKVSCVSGGATTMLIIGLLVGGLILICIIAFAYAKFSDRRQKDEDEEDSKKGSSAARRAAMEETVGKDEKKRRKSQKIVENPTNKMKPESGLVGANMIHDPNGMYARNSPDSYTSGFPLMMSSAGIGHNPYEFRSPPALSPTSFNPYESFMLPHGPHPMQMKMAGLQRHASMSPGTMSQMTGMTSPGLHIGPSGGMVPNRNFSQSFGAYDHVSFQGRPLAAGVMGGIKSKSLAPDGYQVPI